MRALSLCLSLCFELAVCVCYLDEISYPISLDLSCTVNDACEYSRTAHAAELLTQLLTWSELLSQGGPKVSNS